MALYSSGTQIADVALTDTFNTWRTRFNSSISDAASTSANNIFVGQLNKFNAPTQFANMSANTAAVVGLNVTTTFTAKTGAFAGAVTAPIVTANSLVGPLTGTLQTAAQPNITSVGTLTSIATDGPVTAPTVTANSFVGALTGAATSAASATTATTVTLVATNTTDATHYPIFVDAATGNENPRTDTGLTYNPNSGTLAATDFNATSDITYKEQITPIDNALEIVEQLAGKVFNWKHTGKKSYGVIAQEVEQVLPDVVTTNENGKAVNYNTLIALLIESNKQLNKKIKLLEQKL